MYLISKRIINIYIFKFSDQLYTFKTEWSYDSWNRVDSIIYPDNEVVTYQYNEAGQLNAMESRKGSRSYQFIDEITYDKFGSRIGMDYGNGASIQYHYDDTLHRLHQLVSKDGNSVNIQDITYNYDNAGNITGIANTAGVVNGMGGDYNYSYSYDSLYRLTQASGNFHNNDYSYNLSMEYSPSGNIETKYVNGLTSINGMDQPIDHDKNYTYSSQQPHALAEIEDAGSGNQYTYNYDANGNLTYTNDDLWQNERHLCWDEENRLMAVKDANYLSAYLYNAGGQRTWKFTGPVREMTINGDQVVDYAYMEDKTLYASEYMVANDANYTKHYYIEGQRIASKIGGGFGLNDIELFEYQVGLIGHFNTYDDYSYGLYNLLVDGIECTGHNPDYLEYEPFLASIEEMAETDDPEEQQYFYHPDHLGSSSFITDASGDAHQHLQYLPFGEDFISQRIDWQTRYTFSAKEKDKNTGYHYFGARYYDSEVSVWLSVDPLASGFPGISAYAYCYNSPTMYVDPWGLAATEYRDKETGDLIRDVDDGIDQVVDVDKNQFINREASFNREGKSLSNKSDAKEFAKGYENESKKYESIVFERVNNSENKNGSQTSFFMNMGANLTKDRIIDKSIRHLEQAEDISRNTARGIGQKGPFGNYSSAINKMKNIKIGLKWIGRGTALYGMYSSWNQYNDGLIGPERLTLDFSVHTFSSIPGAGHYIGLQYFAIDNTVGVKRLNNYLKENAIKRAEKMKTGFYPAPGRAIR